MRLIQPRTSCSSELSCERDFWRLPLSLTAKPSSRSPRTGYIQMAFSATQYGLSPFEQSVTTVASLSPLPPFISLRSLRLKFLRRTSSATRRLEGFGAFLRFLKASAIRYFTLRTSSNQSAKIRLIRKIRVRTDLHMPTGAARDCREPASPIKK